MIWPVDGFRISQSMWPLGFFVLCFCFLLHQYMHRVTEISLSSHLTCSIHKTFLTLILVTCWTTHFSFFGIKYFQMDGTMHIKSCYTPFQNTEESVMYTKKYFTILVSLWIVVSYFEGKHKFRVLESEVCSFWFNHWLELHMLLLSDILLFNMTEYTSHLCCSESPCWPICPSYLRTLVCVSSL